MALIVSPRWWEREVRRGNSALSAGDYDTAALHFCRAQTISRYYLWFARHYSLSFCVFPLYQHAEAKLVQAVAAHEGSCPYPVK